jgi:hypothetical protein
MNDFAAVASCWTFPKMWIARNRWTGVYSAHARPDRGVQENLRSIGFDWTGHGMAQGFSLRNRILLRATLALMVTVVAVVAWSQRTALLTRYYVYRLTHADENERQAWVERVAGMDSALPRLIDCLRQTDGGVCANAQAGLAHLAGEWDPSDERRADLASRLAAVFSDLSICGQQKALELEMALLTAAQANQATTVVPAATRSLAEASRVGDEQVRRSALLLAGSLLESTDNAETLATCRRVTQLCLNSTNGENRVQAVRLTMRPGMNLQESVVSLLGDPVAEVRRAALLAVGSEQTAISTDDLLPWLHDPDEDARRLCEKALRSRGLREEHLKLARLMTDGRPATRLQVLDLLGEVDDLEPGVWLRRLSHDSAPAVRAAAIRAAAEQITVDLSDRLQQMTQNDPCPTVRQLASFYLSSQKSVRADFSKR